VDRVRVAVAPELLDKVKSADRRPETEHRDPDRPEKERQREGGSRVGGDERCREHDQREPEVLAFRCPELAELVRGSSTARACIVSRRSHSWRRPASCARRRHSGFPVNLAE
jgi:hypothetical protein